MCSSCAGGDPHALSDVALLAEVAELVAERNRVEARLTAAVRAADARSACEADGLKTMQSWLRTHGGLRPSSAAAPVHRGRALDLLPATAAAFAAGAIGVDHVTEIGKVAAPHRVAAAADQRRPEPGRHGAGHHRRRTHLPAPGRGGAALLRPARPRRPRTGTDRPAVADHHHPPRRHGDRPRRTGRRGRGEGQSRARADRRHIAHRR
ncbi:hypothetical protein DQ240_02920 [Blastococcus sp. TF02A-26]|nr:hypothetical protein DQ240_02920 [Blastococcus sp. TF02A-26]